MAKARAKSNGGGGEHAPEQAPLVAIVDDDASVGQSTDRLIRSVGYRTQMFGSGQEFLSSEAVEPAACLLLDVRMPGMNGLEVQRRLIDVGAHWIRSRPPHALMGRFDRHADCDGVAEFSG
jgi:CheY-like chemotaxis protein